MTTIPYLEEELEKTTEKLNYYKNYSNRLLNDNKKKNKEIERLTAESTEWESKYYVLQEENEKLKEDIKILTSDDNDSFWYEEENM